MFRTRRVHELSTTQQHLCLLSTCCLVARLTSADQARDSSVLCPSCTIYASKLHDSICVPFHELAARPRTSTSAKPLKASFSPNWARRGALILVICSSTAGKAQQAKHNQATHSRQGTSGTASQRAQQARHVRYNSTAGTSGTSDGFARAWLRASSCVDSPTWDHTWNPSEEPPRMCS